MSLIELKPTPLSKVTRERFTHFNIPMFVKGGCMDMPAIRKWSDTEYLIDKFRDIDIDIEIYNDVKAMQQSKSKIQKTTFNEYLNNLDAYNYLPDASLNKFKERGLHHDIFSDLDNPMDMEMGQGDIANDYYLFLGKNTKTGMHLHVEDDFLLNQIVGKKKVYLMRYEDLQPNSMFSKYGNFATENFWDIDWDKKDIYYVELYPGDQLCIPPWWWHAVDSPDFSVAVTKIYEREDKSYLDNPKYKALKYRHLINSGIPMWFENLMKRWF